MFAMVGATLEHNGILGYLFEVLLLAVRTLGCSAYGLELRLHVAATVF
ncbi:MAG TPA: hypothetical protein VFA65_12185 [Bryobacteraceae bacterium]|nr:hypothetical protein [Bryobacteraceae bacterium]